MPPAAASFPARSTRLEGIDVLRGLSIIAVVLHHTNLHMRFNHAALDAHMPQWLDRILWWNGANGVTMFFAVSGFLITSMSLRRWGSLPGVAPRQFYRLRFARIAPLIVALLAVLSVLHLAHATGFVIRPERSTLPRALLAALTFHVNWLESAHGYLPANWDVLWSLSVEEMFYIFFPLIARLCRRPALFAALLLAFVALGPFARTILFHQGLWQDYGYLSCMDCIALGCLTALIAPRLSLSSRAQWILRIAGVSLVALVTIAKPLANALHLYQSGLDVTALALGACMLVLVSAKTDRPGRWLSAPLRWFGRNSYEVYLTHMFVVLLGVQLLVARPRSLPLVVFGYAAMLVLAGVLGALVARTFSEPANRALRRGWQPQPEPALLEAAQSA